MSTNLCETIVLVITIIAGLPPLLNSLQILWINLITGFLPSIALGRQPISKNVMIQKKRHHFSSMFDFWTVLDIIVLGLLMGALSLLGYLLTSLWLKRPDQVSTAVTFATLMIIILIQGYNARNPFGSIFGNSMWKDWRMHISFLVGIISVIGALYIPFINSQIFHHEPFGIEWVMVVILCIIFVFSSEIYKLCKILALRLMKKRENRKSREKIEFMEPVALEEIPVTENEVIPVQEDE